MNTIAIIDYGMSNLSSVVKAVKHVAPNDNVIITSNSNEINNIGQLNLSENIVLCCIIRNNEFIFDSSNVLLEQGDRLVCLVNKKDVKQIEDLFE